jgi:hypothetical protein
MGAARDDDFRVGLDAAERFAAMRCDISRSLSPSGSAISVKGFLSATELHVKGRSNISLRVPFAGADWD